MIRMSLSITVLIAVFLGACSPDSPKLVPAPDLTVEKVVKDNDYQVFDPKVDILFVVDNSGSMDSHQKDISTNVGRFVAAFFNRVSIDYHIGVVSTDMDQTFNGKCCGRLIGDPTFIQSNTVNPAVDLAGRLLLGTNGSGTEKLFDPVLAALSAPIESTINKGFLRPEAHLAVIFITDAEDQSQGAGTALYDFLVKLKGKREKVLAYGAIIPSGIPNDVCPRDDYSTEPHRIEQFLSLTINKGKNEFNLCAADFGDKLAQVAQDLAKQVSNTIYLNRAPVIKTLKVTYGTQLIANDPLTGWTFDPSLNALFLGDNLSLDPNQPVGSKIKVDFDAASY